jgi:hypothetical protein
VPTCARSGDRFDKNYLDWAALLDREGRVRLCHSLMLLVRAYPREKQEVVFDAHDRAFALFKGIYD